MMADAAFGLAVLCLVSAAYLGFGAAAGLLVLGVALLVLGLALSDQGRSS